MTTDEISGLFETISPRNLAESWDNPGWQVRLFSAPVTGILLAVDATVDCLVEAERLGCNVLFTHHPAIFKAIKSMDVGTPQGAILAQAIRRGISVWSAHTNLDVMPDGTSFALAKSLGLKDPEVLAGTQAREYKLAVYVPISHVDAVKKAMAEAGAGQIGDYGACFWQVLGTGQFKAEKGADPYIGEVGEIEQVEEYKVESIVHQARLLRVMEAMRQAHPYEEVAYDLFALENPVGSPLHGYGAVGRLDPPMSTADVARHATGVLPSAVCAVAGRPERVHERVAVVGGSGTSFIADAIRRGASLFITADVRYHDAQDAVAKGLDLIILDHYATERPVLESVQARLSGLAPGVPVHISAVPSSPYVRIEP